MSAGKEVSKLRLCHVLSKLVADEVSIAGKEVREEQLYHARAKFVPDDVLISGKDVRDVQSRHASLKFVADEVSIKGKEVREEQSRHCLEKSVTLPNALLAAAPLSTKYCSIEVISLALSGDEEIKYPTGFFKNP